MKVTKGFIILSLGILCVFTFLKPSRAQTTSPYVNPLSLFSPANLLRTPIGARASGLAAFTGNPDDLSAVFYNPAGLSKTNYWELQLSHRDDNAKVDFDSFVTNIPFSRGSVAFYGVYTHVYDYENIYYGVRDNPYSGYKGGYSGASLGLDIVKEILAIGLGVKWISVDAQAEYQNETSTLKYNGLLTDLALQFNYDLSKFRKTWSALYYLPKLAASIAAMNIHPKTGGEKEFKERTGSLNIGISLYYSQTLAFNVDFIQPIEIGERSVRLGLEFWPTFFLSLRGGVSTEYVYDYITYFAGFGIGNKLGINHISFEYAFEADNYKNRQLEQRHQFSIVNSFGGKRYEEKIKDDKPYKMHKLQR